MKYAAIMYHALITSGVCGKFDVAMDTFRQQINYIKTAGFNTIDLSSDVSEDANKVLVTFDDGHSSNLAAAEEMAKIKQKGVFYIIKDKSNTGGEYLDAGEIRALVDMGHLIGIHGLNHKWWTLKSDVQFLDEFWETKAWLEDIIGKPIVTCSAPGGKINTRIKRLIGMHFPDIRWIRTSVESYNDDSLKKGVLNCVAISQNTTMQEFSKILHVDALYYAQIRAAYFAKAFVKGIIGR